VKLRRGPIRRGPLQPPVPILPEIPRELAGKWVAWARSGGANYQIVAAGDELGDVLDQVFQRGLRYGVTYQRLPAPDKRPVG
jgi:hypothetical protein